MKTNALNFKVLADQFIEIDIARHDIATERRRRTIVQLERAAKFVKKFERKKRELSLVIIFEIEIAVAANAATSHAFDYRHFDCRIIAWFAPVMADKIVPGRNVKMAYFHRTHDNIETFVFT